MTRFAIDMARKRKMERDGNYTLEGIIASKRHHLLRNDDRNILIFGDDKAIQRMATTNTIHADGTFSCVLDGFSQLYIFHSTMENNVSLPVLFCLLNGKDEQTYVKLLGMVEELPVLEGTTVWDREVVLMRDFELAQSTPCGTTTHLLLFAVASSTLSKTFGRMRQKSSRLSKELLVRGQRKGGLLRGPKDASCCSRWCAKDSSRPLS